MHPGGEKIIRNHIGCEIEEAYNAAGHSKHGIDMMSRLPELGKIKGATGLTPFEKDRNDEIEINYDRGILL